ncbi:MAG: poly(A) polymerase [Spirochaetales bacterium]|nr:poly(A) polymerase [Spirochaetales bacterium]
MIDRDALWAIKKIQGAGGEAYIVGGAIRDIMLGHTPKDFDIGTSLSPRQVQRLFWNSRIIGKRFRIVHLFFGEKIIEVTTFRSDEENFEEGNNNVWGTIEQDARRRDFSINSLYYNPQKCELLDFGGSMEDFEKGVIRSLIPLKYSFVEDPVRMIRAVKYKVTTGFSLKWDVKFALLRNASQLQNCPASRLTEEVVKILSSGHSADIFHTMYQYRLLQYLLPAYAVHSELPSMSESLRILDAKVLNAQENGLEKPGKAEMFYYMIRSAIIIDTSLSLSWNEYMKDAFRQAKVMLSPITPANFELERAVTLLLSEKGIRCNKPKKKKKTQKIVISDTEKAVNPKVKRRKRKKSNAKPKEKVMTNTEAKAE